uniref:Uncharacterized protein n=1 Tax=viral metagenome TaxID=1070528 RepID=A0A6C0B8V9_9ZZZZ
MTQYLFSKPNLDPYRTDVKIRTSLQGVELLNLEEFKAVFRIPLRRSGRQTKETAAAGEAAAIEAEELSLSAAIKQLTENVCQNKINEAYLGQSFLNAYNLGGLSKYPEPGEVEKEVAVEGLTLPELSFEDQKQQQLRNNGMLSQLEEASQASQSQSEEESQREEDIQLQTQRENKLKRVTKEIEAEEEEARDKPITFDLLIAFAPGFRDGIAEANTKSIDDRTALLLEKVVGFIIVQLGECTILPNAYAVNLICTRTLELDDGTSTTIKGALLMGAYLFCIKKLVSHGVQQVGILELADGYKNFAGFSSYTKMMFDKDIALCVEGCFYDNTNLAMSVNLQGLSEQEIIDLATGKLKRLPGPFDDTGMYGLVPTNLNQNKLQKIMAVYANLMYKFQVADFQFRNGDERFMNQLLEAPWSILPKNQLEIVNVLYSRYSKVLSPALFPFLIRKLQSYIQTLILTFRRMQDPLGIQTRSDALARKNDMNDFETPAGVASRSDGFGDTSSHVLRSTAAEQLRQEAELERLRQQQEVERLRREQEEVERLRQQQEEERLRQQQEEERLRQQQEEERLRQEADMRLQKFKRKSETVLEKESHKGGGKTNRRKKTKTRKTMKRRKTIKRKKTIKRRKTMKRRKTIKKRNKSKEAKKL